MTDPARDEARRGAHDAFDPIAEQWLAHDDLIVKLPASRVDALVAAGTAARMVMRERALREWVTVDLARAGHWAPLVAEAHAFGDEITP